MNLMKIENGLKMNSIEISDLVESRHDKVKQSIERLVANGAISQPPLGEVRVQRERRAESVEVYEFLGEQGRRDSIVVVAQLSPLFTARLVDRWQELEAQNKELQTYGMVLPKTYGEAIIALGQNLVVIEQQTKQLEVAKPKVEFVDTFVDRGSNRNITSVAKELGITAISLGMWLRAKGYMNKSTKKQEWNKEFIDKGYGVQKLFNTEVKEDTFKSGSQVLVTPAGDLFIKEQVKKHGLVVYFDKQE